MTDTRKKKLLAHCTAAVMAMAVFAGSGIYLFGMLRSSPVPAYREDPEVLELNQLIADYRTDPDSAAKNMKTTPTRFPLWK